MATAQERLASVRTAIKTFTDQGGIGEYSYTTPDGQVTIKRSIVELMELERRLLAEVSATQSGGRMNHFRPGGL